jgi:eukaryotic-like serine/threonine-protein kinase
MRVRHSPAEALLALARLDDPAERLASFRQAVTALGQSVRVAGPPPLDGVESALLTRATAVALENHLADELDFIAPGPAAVALYELMMALPPGAERREVGRRVLTRLYEGTASTFAAVASRMALGSGRALEPATMRARVGLVLDLPVGTNVDADALALSLATRRELSERWMVRPSFGALPARRLAARILEHAAREAVRRSQEGDPFPREVLASETVRPVRRRLLADREPLVWRHAAVSRGLLAAVDPQLHEQIDLDLAPELTPTEWRRAAVSLVATMVAEPTQGLKACTRLLKSEIVKKDPGVVATMLWGLPVVVDSEPDAAEELLDLASATRRPDVAEAVAALLADLIHPTFGARAAQSLRAVLASKLDAEPPALRGITTRTLHALDRDHTEGLPEAIRRAMVAYETGGARAAFDSANEALADAKRAVDRLSRLDAQDEATLADLLSTLADVDAGVLEKNRLWDLLLLGRRPGDSDALVPEMDRVYDALGNWLLDAEEKELDAPWSRLGSLGNQRRLRALLHLVDVETARGEADEAGGRVRARVRRALDVLSRRLAAGPDGSVHRIVCATLARACDAAVREGVAEASDVFLLVTEHVSDRPSVVALSEASTNEEVDAVLSAYAEFLEHDAEPVSRADSTLDTETLSVSRLDEATGAARRVVRLSLGIGAGGSLRAEALRGAVLGLGRALEAVAAARGLSDLVETSSGDSVAFDLETAVESWKALAHGARRRVLEADADADVAVVTDLPALSTLIERAISVGVPPNAPQLATATKEIAADLPGPVSQAISAVLSRLDGLPIVAPSDVVAIPLERRRPQLPDWLLPRRTIGAFWVVRSLGAGGVSSVFVVRRIEERHDSKAESFALKVPHYDPSTARSLSEQEFLQMFKDEAGALISLPHHENIARFVTFDLAARPKPILVMELIRGVGLDRLVRTRALTTQGAFAILDGILNGLDAMHGVGVAHLDVKPSNVILRNDETPVLVDFGLSGRKLRPGCGTLEYCAPEVIGIVPEGHAPGPLGADLYAFAATAFEVLTARQLFQAEDETALVSLQLSHDGWPEPLAELGRTAELREVSVVLAACLRRDPRARPGVSEVKAALERTGKALERKSWPLGPRTEPKAAGL